MDDVPYFRLSALMFLEYAVWGAWMPVLAARLLGPLKMNGKQTGWIYATLPLATMIAPLLAGQLADRYLDTRWMLAACHAFGAVLLFMAARTRRFWPLFGVMLAYSMFYGATIPLVNSLMFSHLTEPDKQSPGIFIWAPVAWALVGYALTGWRNLRKGEGDGSDCLIFGGILSIAMTLVCLVQPATPPSGAEGVPMLKAVSMLGDANFAVFILASLVVAGVMQFYFLGSAQYLQDIGVSQKNVPATMAIAQAAQAVATLFALGLFFTSLGPKWTLTLGAACWALLYLIYVIGRPKWLLVAGQMLHGFAYVFFMIAGQMYVNKVAPADIRGSAQGLIILVTSGIGLFLGTQLAGFMMDRSCVGGKFNWAKVYMVPFLCTAAGVLALAAVFRA